MLSFVLVNVTTFCSTVSYSVVKIMRSLFRPAYLYIVCSFILVMRAYHTDVSGFIHNMYQCCTRFGIRMWHVLRSGRLIIEIVTTWWKTSVWFAYCIYSFNHLYPYTGLNFALSFWTLEYRPTIVTLTHFFSTRAHQTEVDTSLFKVIAN